MRPAHVTPTLPEEDMAVVDGDSHEILASARDAPLLAVPEDKSVRPSRRYPELKYLLVILGQQVTRQLHETVTTEQRGIRYHGNCRHKSKL